MGSEMANTVCVLCTRLARTGRTPVGVALCFVRACWSDALAVASRLRTPGVKDVVDQLRTCARSLVRRISLADTCARAKRCIARRPLETHLLLFFRTCDICVSL